MPAGALRETGCAPFTGAPWYYFLAGAFVVAAFSTVMWVIASCSPFSLSRQVSLTFSPAFRALRCATAAASTATVLLPGRP